MQKTAHDFDPYALFSPPDKHACLFGSYYFETAFKLKPSLSQNRTIYNHVFLLRYVLKLSPSHLLTHSSLI